MANKRLLPTPEAAEYVGCETVKQFWKEVGQEIWPQPADINSRPRRWDKYALDRAIDKHNSKCNNIAVPLD